MRVLIDTTYARRAPFSGTGIYIRRLCEELERIDGVEVVAAWNRRRRPPAGGGLGSARNVLTDTWWSGLELPRIARRAGADVIHHPLPAYAPGTGRPQLITVTDLAYELLPHHFDSGFRAYARLAHRFAARRAEAVICISRTTAADVQRIWGIPPERTRVALLGPGQQLPSAGPPAGPPAHFLYVGDDEPRKNLPVLLAAYARYRASPTAGAPPLRLILAGSATAQAPGVSVIRSPDPARLAALYRDAAALVHPARHEGFGLTPVEAMRLGTPVLAARSAAVTEICGDAVLYADTDDVDRFAEAMTDLAGDAALRERLRAQGRARVSGLSWSQCARDHVDAYSWVAGR
jgi:glycosyltransferase involved in cell wall biosynthesis